MRNALIVFVVLVSFAQLDRRRAKSLVRRLAVWLGRTLLSFRSRARGFDAPHAVVFAPHPDDETMGCGGLIARKRWDGLAVDLVFITDGGASHPDHPHYSRAQIATLRQEEAVRAAARLGVDPVAVHFLGEPDGTLHEISATRKSALIARIAALLVEIQPGEIFLPHRPDGSSEHDAAFGIVTAAVLCSGQRAGLWTYPIWLWWNPPLLLRQVFRASECVRVPTEDYAVIKSDALACYRSQFEPLAPETKAALPEDLSRTLNAPDEYFFRFELPCSEAPGTRARPPLEVAATDPKARA